MTDFGIPSNDRLEKQGIKTNKNIFWNLTVPELIEEAISRKEAILSSQGGLVAFTGTQTGRSPNDKYLVQTGSEDDSKILWGKINHPLSRPDFERIKKRMFAYLEDKDLFVSDLLVGADESHTMPIRVITELAWQALFARNLFIRKEHQSNYPYKQEFTLIACPGFKGEPSKEGLSSEVFVIIDFIERFVLIGGTGYAGEIKKSVFTIMNKILPEKKVLPMHCSANLGKKGDVSIFFGLSGTGKTTLSSDPGRKLIGDDEHGWSDSGVFNFEGGCYAKTIRLSQKYEPMIWDAVNRFGAVIENTEIDPLTRIIDFKSERFTENTRGAYPLDYIMNHVEQGFAGHPRTIFFLSADAFGVLPPIARLTPEQAMYYFLSGYTAKLAGTERGLGTEPQATFSTCFAAPFLPLNPSVYADLLGEKIKKHHVSVWLINTGWIGGGYGEGERINLPYTRKLINTAIEGKLDSVAFQTEPYFHLSIPEKCPGIPDKVLDPIATWKSPEAYKAQALKLVTLFKDNFQQYEMLVSPNIFSAGP